VFLRLVAKLNDLFLEQRISIKFYVKLLLEMKRGAFNMMSKANDKADTVTTEESAHIVITNEDDAHHFLRYTGYCSF
jgi:hypothetical protein